MPEESHQDRTEQPTPRRRQEAREKGSVYKSQEVNAIVVLLASLVLLYYTAAGTVRRIAEMLHSHLSRATPAFVATLTADSLTRHAAEFMLTITSILMPITLTVMISGLAANVAQVGLIFSGNSVSFKIDRLSPLSGLKRMFSAHSTVEVLKGIFKIVLVAWLLYSTIQGELTAVIAVMESQPAEILNFLGKLSYQMGLKITLVLAVLAAFDFAFQRWQYEKNLRMTRQELKEEMKQTEGDPVVKSRIRSMQRETARKRMLTKVPSADVVITNPTTLAIALKYDPKTMNAPVVVAKGVRLVAEKIRQLAKKHGIPIVEDKPLAQALYKLAEVGNEIPFQFYQAIAEIMAYVYKLKNKRSAR